MKIANVKGLIAKSMMFAMTTGAFLVASPVKAEAQRFVVGVRVGQPYYAPRYDRDERFDRYDRYDRYEFERRQAFLRHEEWLRMHRFDHPNGYR